MSSDLEIDSRFNTKNAVRAAHRQFAAMYCKLEFLVFESMKFNTIRPTVVTFLNFFQGLLVTEDDIAERAAMFEQRETANTYLKQFLDLSIKDVEFFNVVPSLLAASIIGAARKLLQLNNYWSDRLITLTRYEVEHIRPMMIFLVDKRYENVYNQDGILEDSGFTSITSSDFETDEVLTKKKRRLLR